MRIQFAVIALATLGASGCSKEFDEYKERSKATEGQLTLRRLVKSVQVALIRDNQYPIATTGLSPTASCCKSPGAKCVPDPAVWDADPWKTLDFSIDDPFMYRVSYASDGKTFTAKVVADLDCDEQEDPREVLSATGSVDAQGAPLVVYSDDKRP
jgi:hypothetical protein